MKCIVKPTETLSAALAHKPGVDSTTLCKVLYEEELQNSAAALPTNAKTLQNEIEQLMLDEPVQDVTRQIEQKEKAFALLRQVLNALQEDSDSGDSGHY